MVDGADVTEVAVRDGVCKCLCWSIELSDAAYVDREARDEGCREGSEEAESILGSRGSFVTSSRVVLGS